MSLYVIGDLHLSMSPNIDKPMDKFGDNWIRHYEKIEKNWRQVVNDDDTVVVAGDISWGLKMEDVMYDLEWIEALPGNKIMIKGNHDIWWQKISMLNSLFDDMTFIQNTSVELDDCVICGTRGWECPGSYHYDEENDYRIYRREAMRLEQSINSIESEKEKICILHYPPTNEKLEESLFTDVLKKYGIKTVAYGHLHTARKYSFGLKGNVDGIDYHLVSADYLDFCPKKLR